MARQKVRLRFISTMLLIFYSSVFVFGCGGGGGSSTGGSTSGLPTGSIFGAANTAEIGGSTLAVRSASQSTASQITNGSYSIGVSAVGTQLLFITDAGNAVRGLTLSTIDQNSQKVKILDGDATSTALSLIMLTPGITTVDPKETAERLDKLKALTAFPQLVAYLRQNLPNNTIHALLQAQELNSLLGQCINEYAIIDNISGPKKLSAVVGSENGKVMVSVTNIIPPSETTMSLINYGYRYVNVYRRDIGFDSKETVHIIATPMDPPTLASWGTLFTGRIGNPTILADPYPADFSSIGLLKTEYWIVGPGGKVSSDVLPQSIQADYKDALGATIVYIGLFPILDIVAGSVITANKAIKIAQVCWNEIKGQINLNKVMNATSKADFAAATADLIIEMISIGVTSGLFESMNIISATAAPVIGLLAGVGTATISAGNLYKYTDDYYSVPSHAKIEVTNSDATGSIPGIISVLTDHDQPSTGGRTA